jgi:hypothetical protein
MPATPSDPVMPSPVSHEVPSMLPDRREKQKQPRTRRPRGPAGSAGQTPPEAPAPGGQADGEEGSSEKGHVNYLA